MKWYLNAFPKAGLHLLNQLIKPLTLNEMEFWAGTYAWASFTKQRVDLAVVTNGLCYTPDNHRLLGHSCYDEDIEWYIALSGIVHIFIHRDLRDVAVSQAHHILSDKENLLHPDRDLYRALGGFEDVLAAVWHGVDKFPGVEERWAEYQPWLDRPNVLVLRYEDAIADLEGTADKILDYMMDMRPAFPKPNNNVRMESSYVVTNADEMVASALDTGASPTFRRGQPGEWRQYSHVFR